MSENAKKLIELCDELMASKILFADKKIDKILECIATSPDIYDLLSECMGQFNKEKEFDKAFVKSSSGKKVFIMPKEEFKVLALVFCLLADIGNGKLKFDELISTYFADENRIDPQNFMTSVIVPFKNLIAEAFGVEEESKEEEHIPTVSEANMEELTPEQRLKIVPFPIERSSNYLKDPSGACQTFLFAKDTAVEMIERLNEERENEQTEDIMLMLHCVVIACLEQDLDLLSGLVTGLKYACRGVKSLRYLVKELDGIVKAQLEHEKSK